MTAAQTPGWTPEQEAVRNELARLVSALDGLIAHQSFQQIFPKTAEHLAIRTDAAIAALAAAGVK